MPPILGNTTTTGENAAATLNGTELVRGVQSGNNVKITTAAIAALYSPTAAAGDLIVRGASADGRLPVGGSNGLALVTDSAQTLKVKWGGPFSATADLANSANGFGADMIAGAGRVCDTIAAVQALAVNKSGGSQRAFALGYSALGTHGGGQFYWLPGDTTTVNPGTVFASTSGGVGRWRRVSLTGNLYVTDFGAVCDGATDDSAAVQAMLNSIPNPSQQRCNLVSGSIKFSNIEIPAGVSLDMPGVGCCTIVVTDTTNPVFRLNSFSSVAMGGGCQAFYPNQVTSIDGVTVTAPVVYPPFVTHATGGCSYVEVGQIRHNGSYIGVLLGDSSNSVANITIHRQEGFPLLTGIMIDNCSDELRIEKYNFNQNVFGNKYADGTVPKWVFQNGNAVRILRCDSYVIDSPLSYGYSAPYSAEGGSPSGSANMGTINAPVFDISQIPFQTLAYQDGLAVFGGSMTGSQGDLGGLTGLPMNLAGGVATNQAVKFDGTSLRHFYDSIVNVATNADFLNCNLYDYNAHNSVPTGAITGTLDNVTLRVIGGRIDGGSHTLSRGINFAGRTGCTVIVDDVTFSNFAGEVTLFVPTGNTLLLGKCVGLGAFFYNGLTCTQDNVGRMCVNVAPNAGTWTAGFIFYNGIPTAGSVEKWVRVTTGSGNVLGTDWIASGTI